MLAIGAADHAGWAHLVAVQLDTRGQLHVVERRRVEIIDDALPRMPYEHEATTLTDTEADTLIARVRTSATTNARAALAKVRDDLAEHGNVVAFGIRDDPGFEIPARYAEARASNRIVYAADGELSRRAFEDAADALGIAVVTSVRKDPLPDAAARLGVPLKTLTARLAGEGKRLGSPWTKEHAHAAARAAIALAGRVE